MYKGHLSERKYYDIRSNVDRHHALQSKWIIAKRKKGVMKRHIARIIHKTTTPKSTNTSPELTLQTSSSTTDKGKLIFLYWYIYIYI